MYRLKRRHETGMIRLVWVRIVYRPKGRYETGMIKLVRVVLCMYLRDDMRLV